MPRILREGGINVGIYLPAELVRRFRAAADELPRKASPNMSRLCREAIEAWLSEHETRR